MDDISLTSSCITCKGTGKINRLYPHLFKDCPHCNGKGFITKVYSLYEYLRILMNINSR